MSRNPARRPDPGIKPSDPITTQPPPPPAGAEATVAVPEDQDRGWILVQWLWPLCFLLLALSEVGLLIFRKATQ